MNPVIPHPRESFDYHGGEAAEQAFLDAQARERLHHAWLLVGPEGVGKATFAYRAARRLLGAAPEPALGLLGARPGDPVCRQIIARAHPDLLVLQRDTEDGKVRKGISVDDARGLPEFFGKSPASAPYRVAIIDAADDLNPSAANAALKILEEPPDRGVLFLVSHAPGGLLATLRSRCRRLRFDPPAEAAAAAWVAAHAEVDIEVATRLARMADCAPGRAWRLGAAGALEADEAARELLRGLPKVDEAQMLTIADSFRGATGAARFSLFFERLAAQVAAIADSQVMSGEGTWSERWAKTWTLLVDLPRQAELLNLDRTDAFYTALSTLRSIG
ncbi:MAG TPA: DNA polymerase III subunit delta' [Caulobacteraceae bacterium]